MTIYKIGASTLCHVISKIGDIYGTLSKIWKIYAFFRIRKNKGEESLKYGTVPYTGLKVTLVMNQDTICRIGASTLDNVISKIGDIYAFFWTRKNKGGTLKYGILP